MMPAESVPAHIDYYAEDVFTEEVINTSLSKATAKKLLASDYSHLKDLSAALKNAMILNGKIDKMKKSSTTICCRCLNTGKCSSSTKRHSHQPCRTF